MGDLTIFDILVLAAVGLFALLGLKRGFVTEVLTLLAWVAAVVALDLFFTPGKAFAETFVATETGAAIVAVIAIFLVSFILFGFIARRIGGSVKKSAIGPVDRVLGLGFGALKGLILAALVYALLTLVLDLAVGQRDRPDWLADARSAPLLALIFDEVREFVEERRAEFGAAEESEAGYEEGQRDALDALFEDAGDAEI